MGSQLAAKIRCGQGRDAVAAGQSHTAQGGEDAAGFGAEIVKNDGAGGVDVVANRITVEIAVKRNGQAGAVAGDAAIEEIDLGGFGLVVQIIGVSDQQPTVGSDRDGADVMFAAAKKVSCAIALGDFGGR